LLQGKVRLFALSSSAERFPALRLAGLTPLSGNLDDPQSLSRLAAMATRVLYLAPPPQSGWTDPRARDLLRALRRRSQPGRLVYGSTSGVYGDCQGDWVAETRAVNPGTPRASRRVDAELQFRFAGRASGVAVTILRIPGIYAPDREGGTPRARLLKSVPVLRAEDDVYTSHIHSDVLAKACHLALWRGRSQRIYNVCDETCLKMGDYFDLAADLYGLPRPPRIELQHALQQLPVSMLSFMQESRRLVNLRARTELGLHLRYPTVATGLIETTPQADLQLPDAPNPVLHGPFPRQRQ
jgi:nucleoside-diphosphate-sugar epimerase